MPIGTSLGAYYESDFHHQAGIETPPADEVKPKDTGDDNVLPPDSDTQANPSGEAKVISAADIKSSNPYIKITRDDINTGIGLALGFAGGGLHTKTPYLSGERISSAALKYNNEIFEAPNHGIALNDIMEKYPEESSFDKLMNTVKDGFTTTKGRFVSREEALDIAKKQNQIKDQVLPALDENSTVLLSEDLK